jgi:hypothetical protein
MLRELLNVVRNSVSRLLPFFQKMTQSTPELSVETVQTETGATINKVLNPTVAEQHELSDALPKITFSTQSVMSEHKGASENEDAADYFLTENGGKIVLCDGVSNNWLSAVVAREFVALAKEKDFWSIEDLAEEDIKRLQVAWVKEFHESRFYKSAQEKNQLSMAHNLLENKVGATSFNQVEIIYNKERKQYFAKLWILGNGGLLIINKNKSPQIKCNGEDSLVSSLGQGFVVGKDKFKIGKPSTGDDINWDMHEENIPLELGDVCYLMSDGIANAFLQMSRDPSQCEKLFFDIDADQLRNLQREGIKNGWIEDDDATFVRVEVGEK